MKHNPFLIFGIVAFAIFAVGVIVSSAIDSGVLGWLIFGVIVLCGIGAVLTAFGMRMYERRTEAKIKFMEVQNGFTLSMAKEGYTLPGSGWIRASAQIAAPAKQKVFDFNPNDIHTAAVNYLLYSRNLLGDNGNRLASAPECASAGNIENYSARSWERIVSHLSNAYGVVRQPGPIANGGGVYVPADIGTVGNLYQHVLLNSAVEALPGVTR